jgi:3-phenylpropionate/trans-cinnamate dioxygenase ferredoxin reductase component
MPAYKYLIIGGGMTAAAAAAGIREVDPSGTIGLIGAEAHPPYDRPPLSKALWKGKSLDSIWRRTDQYGMTLHLGCTVRAVEVDHRRATDQHGTVYTWEKVLLATGGSPRVLPFGRDRIIYYRAVDDYTRLRHLTEQGQHFAVIGSGFIGSEIAAALSLNKKDVVMFFPEAGLCQLLFPPGLSAYVTEYYRQRGVHVRAGDTVIGLDSDETQSSIKTARGQTVVVDGVIAGIGITPNLELANTAGLRTGNGIIVDEQLRTSHPDVYAAGDVAEFYAPALGKRIRVEHEDNANTMGKAAGVAMAGAGQPYHHLPFFYSDLFDLGYEAVGEVDARLEMVEDWKMPYREGVVYYLKDQRVRGVLLWNTWGQVDAARELIASPGPFSLQDLKDRLPARG